MAPYRSPWANIFLKLSQLKNVRGGMKEGRETVRQTVTNRQADRPNELKQ